MRSPWIICASIGLACAALACGRAAQPPSSRDMRFADGVQGLFGIVFRRLPGYRPLTLDLYLPRNTAPQPREGFPLVVYIHGGGWVGGDAHRSGTFRDFPGVLAALSAKGYVVASIEYRLSGEAKFPAQVRDVKAAIRWLRAHASYYGIDPARAVAWGVSAGGHLAGLAAVSCHAAELEPAAADAGAASRISDCLQGAVAWYGVFDMATIAQQAREDHAMSRDDPGAPEWRLLGCFGDKQCDRKRIAEASPITYVDTADPPMLLIVGSADTVVPYQQTLEMADRLQAAGVAHRLIVLNGLDHGLVGRTPQQTRDAALQALAATFRFIDQTIGTASAKAAPPIR